MAQRQSSCPVSRRSRFDSGWGLHGMRQRYRTARVSKRTLVATVRERRRRSDILRALRSLTVADGVRSLTVAVLAGTWAPWPVRPAARIPVFHTGDGGSIPLRAAIVARVASKSGDCAELKPPRIRFDSGVTHCESSSSVVSRQSEPAGAGSGLMTDD